MAGTALGHLELASLGLALTALATAILLGLWRRRPVASYRLAVSAACAALLLPAVQPAAAAWGWPAVQPAAAWMEALARRPRSVAVDLPGPAAEPVEPAMRRLVGELEGRGPPAVDPLLLARPQAALAAEPSRPPGRWMACLLGIYGLGLLVAALRTVRRLAATRRLFRAACDADDPVLASVWQAVSARSRLRGRVRLGVSDGIQVPACFGLARGAILLPRGVSGLPRGVSGARPAALRCILEHELVHLERRDSWVLILQELLCCCFWFHPAAWWFTHSLNELRELSCDWIAVQRAGGRRSYASVLVEYASLLCAETRARPRAALVPWSSSGTQLRRRIEMLTSRENRVSRPVRWLPAACAVALFGGLWSGQLALAASLLQEPAEPDPRPDQADLAALRELGYLPDSGQAPLGLRIEEASPALAAQVDSRVGECLLVSEVLEGTPAERAGLRQYDVILAVGGQSASAERLRAAAERVNAGESVVLAVCRTGRRIEVALGGDDGESTRSWRGWDPYARGDFARAVRRSVQDRTYDELDASRRFYERARTWRDAVETAPASVEALALELDRLRELLARAQQQIDELSQRLSELSAREDDSLK